MPENIYQRTAKFLWMILVLLVALTLVTAFFTLVQTRSDQTEIVINPDTVAGVVDSINENTIVLTGEPGVYYFDTQTVWRQKDVILNEYIDSDQSLNVGDRVSLKVGEGNNDQYYVYEVRQEPAHSLAGKILDAGIDYFVIKDWQDNEYKISVNQDTKFSNLAGQQIVRDDLKSDDEIIVTSYSNNGGDYIGADYIEVVK